MRLTLVAVSSLLYTLLGYVIFFTEIHWGLNGHDWITVVALSGFIYLGIHMQYSANSQKNAISFMLDLVVSVMPAFVFFAGMIFNFNHGGFQEKIVYIAPIVVDVALGSVISFVIAFLTNDTRFSQGNP